MAAVRSDTGANLWFGIASDGTNEGIYSNDLSKWIVRANSSEVTFNGKANTTTSSEVTQTNPSSGTWYYPWWGVNQTGTTAARANNGFRYWVQEGTADAAGGSLIQVGNSTASGTAGNKRGRIRIYGDGAYYTDIYNRATANRNVYFPDEGGDVQIKPTNLYNNTSGATGTITLSQSAANFTYLRIYAMTSTENYRISVDVYSPNGKTAYILGGWQSGTNINYKSACVSISGTSITRASNGFFSTSNNGANTVNNTNVILILRVDGYK